MDYRDRHVVVTGGAGALGTAVVGALTAEGAVCHVPVRAEADAQRFQYRDHPRVKISTDGDLSNEIAVGRLYDGR